MLRGVEEFVRDVNDAAEKDKTGTVGLIVAVALFAVASCTALAFGWVPN
jgi:hypothetical protein